MGNQKPRSSRPSEPWKRKMGVGFSGLERPRDFLIAILFGVAFVLVAMLLAFVAYG